MRARAIGTQCELMKSADDDATDKHIDKKPLIAVSREAVQTAEDAREIAVKKIDEQARADALQSSSDAQARSQAEADDATQLKEQAQSDAANAQAAAAKAQADQAADQATSAAAVAAAQADADKSRLAAEQAQQGEHQADSEKAAMRAQLSVQLNKILETRDSARGLIVSMSDVLFDTGHVFVEARSAGETGKGGRNPDRLSELSTLRLAATPTTWAATT